MSTASRKTSPLAQLVNRRIDELRPRRSQFEIATAAGFESPNFISAIKSGKAKLPLDRVLALAKALEVEPSKLARLAVEQFFEGAALDAIRLLGATAPLPSLGALNATAVALGVEVRAIAHDLKFATQYVSGASSRVEKMNDRLARVMVELDELVAQTRR